jgi:predicted amidohydrolase
MRAPHAVLALIVAVAQAAANPANLIPNPELRVGADGKPEGWTTWSPRPALAPKTAIVTVDGVPGLSLQAERFESFGEWVSLVRGIQPGKYYRFDVAYAARDLAAETSSLVARLSWFRNADGTGEIQRDYVDRREGEGAWRRMFRAVQAPAGAQAVRIELGLRWTERGSVVWKEPRLTEVPAPKPRVVRVATTRIAPGPNPTLASNTQLFADMFDHVGPAKPDVLLFSETLLGRGTRLPLAEKAQTIPGPLTDLLAERARKFHTYVILAMHERDGDRFYNTAVLIDRAGRIAGKYRKVHLAMEEADAGLTPGSEYPVFETDFGKIGLLVCWDYWFTESARMMRLHGAEILFLPLAGDGHEAHWDVASRARAMDNGLYLISSGTVSDASRIINPNGDVLGEARGNFAYVLKELDLNQEWRLRYLSAGSGTGEAKSLYLQERRPETYSELSGTKP